MGKGFDGRQVALDLVPEREIDPLPPGTGHRLSLKGDNKGNRLEFLRATRKLPNCTDQHLKLLYLISLHARQAMYMGEQEVWMRKNSLLALVYEAITAGVLDYDYAPEVVFIGRRRVWVNVSQDAMDDIDDLVCGNLLRELKSVTRAMQPVQSIQVTKLGLKVAENTPSILHRIVEGFAFHDDEILTARWAERPIDPDGSSEEEEDGYLWDVASEEEDEPEPETQLPGEGGDSTVGEGDGAVPWWEAHEDPKFLSTEVVCIVETASGSVCRLSDVTKPEDVSYVASPHLPSMLIDHMTQLQPLSNNAHRAREAAKGVSLVKDQSLSEQIHLDKVEVLVSEWLPYGPNQIAALNERLGGRDTCKGGMFTSERDVNTHHMHLRTTTDVTTVKIIEAHDINHINLEASIHYPEEEGVVQVEAFGIHLNKTGGALYGMKIEAIQDRVQDNIPLDLLARLLVDAHQDSSTIADTLLSEYQMELLREVFGHGDTANRVKFNCIIASSINPKTRAGNFADGEDKENELKQVIGAVEWTRDLSVDDMIFVGQRGILLAGPNVTKCVAMCSLHRTGRPASRPCAKARG